MAYQTGDQISLELITLNTDINKLRADQNPGTVGANVAGFGYGATPITIAPVSGDIIYANEWAAYYQSVNQVALHQGITNPLPSTALTGDIAYAFAGLNTFINTLTTNRFNIDGINAEITAPGGKLTDSRSAAWDNAIEHRYTASFTSWNQARHFFNTGGQIRQSMSHVGGSTAVDTALRVIESQLGTVAIDANVFYNLTSTFSTVMTATSGTTVGTVNARLNGAPGIATVVEIQLILTSPADAVTSTGTTNSFVGERRSSVVFNAVGPTYSTSISLTAGGGTAGPITSVTVSGGGNKSCTYNPVSSPDGCYTQWTLSASVSGGSGSYSYNWSSPTSDYIIFSGQGTSSVVVRTIVTTANLASTTITCNVTDTLTSDTEAGSTSVNGNSSSSGGDPPFTSVSIIGGGTRTCTYNPSTDPAGCYNEWTLEAVPVGGPSSLGNFNFTWSIPAGYTLISGSLSGPGAVNITIRSTTETVATDPPPTAVDVSVYLGTTGTTRTASAAINSNHQTSGSSLTGVTLSPSASDQTCRWDYDGSTYPTSCSVSWSISASPIGGSGPFTYSWTVNTAGYSITSGGSSSTVNVSSSSGTTDLPTLSVTCVVTDTSNSSNASSGATSIGAALRRPGPITNVVANASGSNTYSCTSTGSPCTVTSTWTMVPVGGSGSFSYSVNEVSDPAGIVSGSMSGSTLTVTSSATG